tara:strand:- start:2522 stop:3310 length:789 start_codon:yes stop_codon:yes gene_type:complete
MKVPIYSANGELSKNKIDLPNAFGDPVRVDMIRRAVKAARANRRQSYGPSKRAGLRHSVSWPGKGRGMARTPRKFGGSGPGAEAPNTVGGRRAHPPVVEKKLGEKMNVKERRKAFRSALAATTDLEMVKNRGHLVDDGISLPFVVDDAIEKINEVNDDESLTGVATDLIEELGISADIQRAKEGRHIRAGKGKLRGRKYRVPKSALLVLSEFNGTELAFRNIQGVDVTTAAQLNTELLAPGGAPGRLVIFTKNALKKLEDRT